MITQEKLKIFQSYGGDVDMWARSGSSKEKTTIQTNDWYLIESLIHEIKLSVKGQATRDFIQELNIRLQESCDTQQTKEQLEKIAEQL